ncbi:hypothetical protein LWI28_004958 [Acer negundo]|uniref:Uncharacterized protein n=1 Tax=Acer negundo TaxID=4023 RepID=A0AAD5NTR5_ACENE|nr:hypothetical protein LWI28_004958 [Acer negundo]
MEIVPKLVPEVGQATAAAPLAKIRSRLKPSAMEWDLWLEQAPEEERGLPYVERVYVHRPEPMIHRPPLFGKIVFKAPSIPIRVLNGEEQTKFMVGVKNFDPYKKKMRQAY